MKKITLLFLVYFSFIFVGFGQNLVGNPSFEDTVNCPVSLSQIDRASGWNAYSSSPDYFSTCSDPSGNVSVPDNIMGHRFPASGNAYCGIINYVKGETNYSLNREIIGRQLTTPLINGQKYFASFKVSLVISSNSGNMATDKLGMLFSTQPYTNTDSSTIPPIENFAHIYTDSIIKDTVNWTMISGSFIADSSYNYICIGNFFKNDNTDTLTLAHSPFSGGAYYFIDDIRVSTDSLFTVASVPFINELNSFSFYPNPTNGIIKIKVPYKSSRSSIIVRNALGQNVYSSEFKSSDDIDLSFLENGVYLILISNNNRQYSTKLIIQK